MAIPQKISAILKGITLQVLFTFSALNWLGTEVFADNICYFLFIYATIYSLFEIKLCLKLSSFH
jgi:hypothetical protein